MLWGEAGRSMHETVWKSPLIQDFPAWANWWNSSWNTGNHFTRQTFLKTETSVVCPLTQWYRVNASYTDAIVYFKAAVKGCIGRTDNIQLKITFFRALRFFFKKRQSVSPNRNSLFIQWIMTTHHEGQTNLYTLRSNSQHYKTTK